MDDIYSFVKQFRLLYRVPPDIWLLIAAGLLLLWGLLMGGLVQRGPDVPRRGRIAVGLNLVLMLAGLLIIILVTFVRRGSAEHRVILYPFRMLYGMKAPGDYWQVTIMNLVLYVPFSCGLTFCFCRGHGWFRRHPAWGTVLICLLLSVTAELLQYFCGSGLAEMDDVLVNTLGGALGTIPYIICRHLNRIAGPLRMGRGFDAVSKKDCMEE